MIGELSKVASRLKEPVVDRPDYGSGDDPKKRKFPKVPLPPRGTRQRGLHPLSGTPVVKMDPLTPRFKELEIGKTARLVKKHREDKGRKEWALVSKSKPEKVLQWFGTGKPSKSTVEKAERRVQYFKHKGRLRVVARDIRGRYGSSRLRAL